MKFYEITSGFLKKFTDLVYVLSPYREDIVSNFMLLTNVQFVSHCRRSGRKCAMLYDTLLSDNMMFVVWWQGLC